MLEFIPNWQRNKDPRIGGHFKSKEEAMLFAISEVLRVGGSCSWKGNYFESQKKRKKKSRG
jgi:hypothetical protein